MPLTTRAVLRLEADQDSHPNDKALQGGGVQAFGRPVCRPSLTCLARPDTGWTNRPSGQSHEPRPLPLLRDLPQTARWRPELPHPLGLSTSLQQTSQPTKPCPLQNLLRDHKSGSRSYCMVMRAHVYTHTLMSEARLWTISAPPEPWGSLSQETQVSGLHRPCLTVTLDKSLILSRPQVIPL